MKITKTILLVVVAILMGNCTIQLPDISGDAITATPQTTYTLTPTIKPSETAGSTHTPTNTLTLTPTLTWTPLPTLSAYERDAQVRELLETNGGCELPCWWGITPNKTSWAEALHFLSPFISDMKQGSTNKVSQNGKVYTHTNINIYYLTPKKESAEIWFSIRDKVVLHIAVFPPSTQYKYQLHQLLSLLGNPKQVYIVARSMSMGPNLPPTRLILDYSDIGVWAAYSYVPYVIGENLQVCPQSVGARLELDDPTISSTYLISKEELVNALGDHMGTPQKIEDATNMTTEIFYNTFIDPTLSACLETPANLWP